MLFFKSAIVSWLLKMLKHSHMTVIKFNVIGDERSLNTNCTLCSLKGRRCRTLIKDVHFNHGHATEEMESRMKEKPP